MNRRPLAWLLAFPLMTAGSVLAHGLAYRLVAPDPDARVALLDRTGHGYLDAAPLVLGVCLAFLLAGLAAHGARAFRRRSPAQAAAWPLALLPLLGFALQEHFERLSATGDLPLTAALEPTFLVGLALQLPFALVALVAARALGRAAEIVGRALAPVPPRPAVRPRTAMRPVVALLPNAPRLAAAQSGRAPPC